MILELHALIIFNHLVHVHTDYTSLDRIFLSANGQALADQYNISVIQVSNQNLSLSNRVEQSRYEQVLSEVYFVNTDDEPGNRFVMINFTVNEDSFVSIAIAQVEIIPTNDPVVFSFVEKFLQYLEEEQQSINLFNTSDTLSDSDGSMLEFVRISILNSDPFDTLAADAGASTLSVVTDSSSSANTLIISGSANLSVYESVLQTVTFVNTFPGISPQQRNISVITFDGETLFTAHRIFIAISLFDDPPICYFNQLVSLKRRFDVFMQCSEY